MVIKRYLDDSLFEHVKKDCKFLTGMVSRSYGEVDMELRENYFNLYYRGDSLAKVDKDSRGYKVEIHEKFADQPAIEKLVKSDPRTRNIAYKKIGKYVQLRVPPENLHLFFQKKNLELLEGNIKEINHGEEIAFEQVLITDNLGRKDLIIIDRQVAEKRGQGQIDLLALYRNSNGSLYHYHFLVIEVKLGHNPELSGKVGEQIASYINRISENISAYVECYKKNYQQKKELGLFPEGWPSNIEIEKKVEGLIVVGGYSIEGEKQIKNLKQKREKDKSWDFKVIQIVNKIDLSKAI